MSGNIKTPLLLGKGTLTFEGKSPTGKPVKVVFHNVRQMDADQVVVEEVWDSEVLMIDQNPIDVKRSPSEYYLNIDNLRLLRDEKKQEIYRYETQFKWFMATCKECGDMKIPFKEERDRGDWTRQHVEANGHTVKYSEEDRG